MNEQNSTKFSVETPKSLRLSLNRVNFKIGQHFIEILRDATPIKSENKRMKKVFINANKMNLNSHLFVGSFFVLGFNLMCDHGNTLSMHSH